jgi:hypothetical protein
MRVVRLFAPSAALNLSEEDRVASDVELEATSHFLGRVSRGVKRGAGGGGVFAEVSRLPATSGVGAPGEEKGGRGLLQIRPKPEDFELWHGSGSRRTEGRLAALRT